MTIGEDRRVRLASLRRLYTDASNLGLNNATVAIGKAIMEANRPEVGETLYADSHGKHPVVVTNVEGTRISFIPADVTPQSTHQGNLYDAAGGNPYYVDGATPWIN